MARQDTTNTELFDGSEENNEKTIKSTKIPLDTKKEPDKKIAPDPLIKTTDSKNKNEQKSDENGK